MVKRRKNRTRQLSNALQTMQQTQKQQIKKHLISTRGRAWRRLPLIVILSGPDDKEVFKFKDAKFSKGVWEIVAESGEILTLKEEKGEFILHTDFCDYKLTKQ